MDNGESRGDARVWRGKGYPSPSQLACKLLATVPVTLSQHRTVVVLADTEEGTVEFLQAVRKRSERAVVGRRCNRQLLDGRTLKQLYRSGRRGQQVQLTGMSYRLTVSWFWLHRAEGKRELRECRFHLSLLRSLSGAIGTQTLLQLKAFSKPSNTALDSIAPLQTTKRACLPLAHLVADCLSISPLD